MHYPFYTNRVHWLTQSSPIKFYFYRTYAGLRSAQVLWGRCYEEQGMPPYWPWVQAIRSYVRERDPEQLRSEMGAGAADIAEPGPVNQYKCCDVKSLVAATLAKASPPADKRAIASEEFPRAGTRWSERQSCSLTHPVLGPSKD